MCEAVEERGGHLGITEHAGPFTKAQVGCDDDAGALVEFTQKVEQQRATGSAERQISELIEDHQISFHQHLSDLSCLALGLFLLQRIDQLDRGEEAHTLAMMLDCLNAEGGSDM